jgi:hypothetical protein
MTLMPDAVALNAAMVTWQSSGFGLSDPDVEVLSTARAFAAGKGAPDGSTVRRAKASGRSRSCTAPTVVMRSFSRSRVKSAGFGTASVTFRAANGAAISTGRCNPTLKMPSLIAQKRTLQVLHERRTIIIPKHLR